MAAAATSLSSIGLGWVLTNKIAYPALTAVIEWFINWAANHGLLILNFAYIDFSVTSEKKAFESAMSAAIKFMEEATSISPEKIKELDDEVIFYYDKFATIKLRRS